MEPGRKPYDWTGVCFVAATLLGWASVLLFLKHLAPHIDGWTANGWRYGLSALMWLPILVVGTRRGTLPAGLWRRALVPSIVNCIGQACFALTPYYIGPGLAAFLLRVSLVVSTTGAMILFADERVLLRSKLFWGGLGLVLAGSIGTVLMGSAPLAGATATGVVLGLCAGAFFGLYGLSVRFYMRGVPAITSFAAISLYTAIGMVAAMILKGGRGGLIALDLSGFNWFMLIASAVVGIALGHVFYYAAMARLGVAVASAVIQLAPFLCAFGSMLIFQEVLTTGQWASGCILVVGAMLLLRAEQIRPREQEVVGAAQDRPHVQNSPLDQPALAEGEDKAELCSTRTRGGR